MIPVRSPFLNLTFSLLGEKKSLVFWLTFAAGLFNALLVVLINLASDSISKGQSNFGQFALFLVCVAGYAVAQRRAARIVIEVVGRWFYETQQRIAGRLLSARLQEFERLEKTSVYKSLIENNDLLMDAARMLPLAASAFVMVVASMAYIYTISKGAFIITLLTTAGSSWAYLQKQKVINAATSRFKKLESRFLSFLNHMLGGMKELKVHRARREDLYDGHMRKTNAAARRTKVRTEWLTVENHVFAEAFIKILVASVVFLLPRFTSISTELVLVLSMAILYALGPLGQVIGLVPTVFKADWAIDDMRRLEDELKEFDESEDYFPENALAKNKKFSRLRLDNLAYTYPSSTDNGRGFRLGPVNMEIGSGELVFLVGGNGSGKSTFLKLLAGFYVPEEGRVLVDTTPVDATNRISYREYFSVLFSDFHLFDRLYGLHDADPQRVQELLERMDIADKTSVVKGRFTNLNLSSGQKKRLGLAVCLLEDKPVYILDEVAADLDPTFRKEFYERMLPELRDQGKTILAVSHDDRYFHVADRVVKMHYGTVEDVYAPGEGEEG